MRGGIRWQRDDIPDISDVIVADTVVYGSSQTTLHALAAEDGSELWMLGDEQRFTDVSAPAVDNTLVYVGCTRHPDTADSVNRRSSVLAFDAVTGAKAWRFEPEETTSKFYAPTVAEGIVYIIGGNFGAGTVGQLYALDGTDGTLQWTRETGVSGISGYDAAPVAVENGVVYLAADDLRALDAATGNVYWTVDRDKTYRTRGANAPTVADGCLYIGRSTDTTAAFEARYSNDGSLAWEYTLPWGKEQKSTKIPHAKTKTTPAANRVWTGAAIDDETVYVGINERPAQNGRPAHVLALSADEGTVRWQQTFNTDRLTVHTPAITDTTLYMGGAALRLDDGRVRWRLDTPIADRRNEFSPPAIANETVYIGGESLRAITG